MSKQFADLSIGRLALAAGLLALSLCLSALSAEPRHPANEDLRHVRALSKPTLSPDGRQVLLQVADATADGGRSHLWLVDVALNAFRQLTFSPQGDEAGEDSGTWLPQTHDILFLAKRGEHRTLFRLPLSGGEAQPFDLKVAPPFDESREPGSRAPGSTAPDTPQEALTIDVETYAASPDGRLIAVVARDPETAGEKKLKSDRNDAVWKDHDQHLKRLYLLDLVTKGLTPVAIPADVTATAWANNGHQLLALAEEPNNRSDLGPSTSAWLVDASANDTPVRLRSLPPAVSVPAWSVDDSQLYFQSQSEHESPPGYPSLYALDLKTHAIRNLTPNAAGTLSGEPAIPTSGGLLQAVQFGVRGTYQLLRAGKLEVMAFDHAVAREMNCTPLQRECVWLEEDGAKPPVLKFSSGLGGAARVLSSPEPLPGQWPTVAPLTVRWKNGHLDLEGLLYLPPGNPAQRHPMTVWVHGGPTGAWMNSFLPLAQLLVGQGWAVFQPNPRGSTGYGAAFAAANRNDLGGGDFQDIMTGVDAVTAKYPVDSGKLALIGYSYGGEMAAFAEGNTDRFRVIVSGAPVTNQLSEYGTETGSWYDRWFYGKPWEHLADAWRQSPIATATRGRTPMLILHGEADTVDPLGQGLELYRALRQSGVPVEMIQYPRDDHGPLEASIYGFPSAEPWHGFDARRRMIDFIAEAFDRTQSR